MELTEARALRELGLPCPALVLAREEHAGHARCSVMGPRSCRHEARSQLGMCLSNGSSSRVVVL